MNFHRGLIKPGANSPEDLVAKFRETAAVMLAGLDWKLDYEGLASPLSLDCKRHALLILKEALHNIRKHAAAERVTIRLAERDGLLEMEIADNGSGFDPMQKHEGFGLQGIRERTEGMGGKISILSGKGKGTSISVVLPIGPLLQTQPR